MRKQLLLAATLGAIAIMPAAASAHDTALPSAVSSFGVRIVVRDGPAVMHHRPAPRLRPQPWVQRFSGPPMTRWRHLPHHKMQHFQWRHGDHRSWFRGPGGRHVGAAAPGRWAHDRPAFRRDFPHDGSMRGHSRSNRDHRR